MAAFAGVFNRGRVMHYLEVFVAAFAVTIAANGQHLLGERGAGVWKSAVIAALIAGGKAVLEAYRKSAAKVTPAPAPPPPSPPPPVVP